MQLVMMKPFIVGVLLSVTVPLLLGLLVESAAAAKCINCFKKRNIKTFV
jgi:hypothetical protein